MKQGVLLYENNVVKNINLELCKKYGPLVMKEMMAVLEKQKGNLQEAIDKEKEAIMNLNQNRKYEETETYQREYDIGERIKIMLNKRRKVD